MLDYRRLSGVFMFCRSACLIATVLFGMSVFCAAQQHWQNPSLLDKSDIASSFGTSAPNVLREVAARKSCSDVYPMPEAAKHWTDCKSGQFSQCGGPNDCTCNDPDDRLVWYECKEGSYARCEDDHTCVDTCRY